MVYKYIIRAVNLISSSFCVYKLFRCKFDVNFALIEKYYSIVLLKIAKTLL